MVKDKKNEEGSNESVDNVIMEAQPEAVHIKIPIEVNSFDEQDVINEKKTIDEEKIVDNHEINDSEIIIDEQKFANNIDDNNKIINESQVQLKPKRSIESLTTEEFRSYQRTGRLPE